MQVAGGMLGISGQSVSDGKVAASVLFSESVVCSGSGAFVAVFWVCCR